jgi:hypothetical protein
VRKPTINPGAAAEERRIRDAVDKAKRDLWFLINRLHLQEKNPAEANYYQALDFTARILNDPNADPLIRKYAPAPGARDKIISALRTGRPPLRPARQGRRTGQGRRTNTFRDQGIAYILEGIRLLGFPKTCGVTKDDPQKSATRQSMCSIVATAWAELKSKLENEPQEIRATLIEPGTPLIGGLTPLLADLRIKGLLAELSYGLRKDAKALSESELKKIHKKIYGTKRAQSQRQNRY